MAAPAFVEQAPHETGFADVFAGEIAPELERAERNRLQHLRAFMVRVGVSAMVLAGLVGVALALPVPLEAALKVLPTILILGLVVAAIWAHRPYKAYESGLRGVIVGPICRFLGDLEYTRKPNGGYGPLRFRKLGVIPGYSRAEVEDMFEGRYRETGFRMVETKLIKGGGRYKTTVFDGLLFEIDVPTSFACRILMRPNRGLVRNAVAEFWARTFREHLDGMHRGAFQDRPFDRHFVTYSDDPAEARELMAPGFRATMVELAEAYGKRWLPSLFSLFRQSEPAAAFAGGKFYLALPVKGDLFEVGSVLRSAYRCERDIRRFMRDVVTARQVIDYLHGDRPQKPA